MKWIIILTIVSFVLVIFIILKGLHDAEEFEETTGKSVINLDEAIFSDLDEENEFSPEHIDLEKTLNILKLRNKLNQIEEEKSINENE